MRPIIGGGQPLLSDGSRQAVAYTSLTSETTGRGAGSRRRWLIAIAVAAAAIAAAVGIPLASRGSSTGGAARPPGVATQTDEHILFVGSSDLDREATTAAQTALASGRIPVLTANPTDADRARIRRAVENALPNAAPAVRQRAAHVLAYATPPIRKALSGGQRGIFRLRVLDNMAEDGDVVWVGLDGVPFGDLELKNAGTELTVALPIGIPAQLQVVAERDGGGGGVTFGAASSQGEIRSRVMNVGDREEWTVVVR